MTPQTREIDMRTKIANLGVLVLALCGTGPALAADSIKEGQWEFSNTMKMAGMPDMSELAKQLPPGMKLPGGMEMGGGAGGMTMKFKHCVTNDNAQPPMKDQDKMKCEMTKQKRSGTRIEWAQHCTGDKTDFTSEGVANYTGDTMASDVTTKGTISGRPADMTMKTTGTYLGACPAK